MSSSEVAVKVKELRELRRMADELNAEIEKITAELKQVMTERKVEELTGADYKLSWKMVESNRFDAKAFRTANPELYNRFTTAVCTRRFVLS